MRAYSVDGRDDCLHVRDRSCWHCSADAPGSRSNPDNEALAQRAVLSGEGVPGSVWTQAFLAAHEACKGVVSSARKRKHGLTDLRNAARLCMSLLSRGWPLLKSMQVAAPMRQPSRELLHGMQHSWPPAKMANIRLRPRPSLFD